MVAPPTTTAPVAYDLVPLATSQSPTVEAPFNLSAPMYGADGWENVEAPVRATDLLQMDGKRIKRSEPSYAFVFKHIRVLCGTFLGSRVGNQRPKWYKKETLRIDLMRASSLAVRTNAVQNGIARKMIGLFY
ncbi:hypothetical protein Tco_1491592 [Tanacetum coccineum]